jgi:hypothetical protein
MTNYSFINVEVSNPSVISRGILWLSQANDNETAIIIIPTFANLEGHITQVIGEKQAKYLEKNKFIQTANNKIIHLATNQSMTHRHENCRILAVYQTSEMLDKIESEYQNISSILAIPWIREDITEWKNTRRATEF